MRLATIRRNGTTVAASVAGGEYRVLPAPDVGALLGLVDWETIAGAGGSAGGSLDGADVAPVVMRPGKIICVGLNYRQHIAEMGRDLPQHPTLFAKFAAALIGARDRIELPRGSAQLDWEAELAVVIGRRVRDGDDRTAAAAIAGFAMINDVTARDWQYRTSQWLQGKTFERTAPFGPVLVTPDELPGGVTPELSLRTEVNGDLVQAASTGDLVFSPGELVAYVSAIVTLEPGDVIASGTPGGVGHARVPPRYLAAGDVLVTEITELGRCENLVAPRAAPT
ncbi:MAG: fumarylacetoacetate hydrolase family protein [Ilumatobacteraceae bacterium]